jgi:hypothetical protein
MIKSANAFFTLMPDGQSLQSHVGPTNQNNPMQ